MSIGEAARRTGLAPSAIRFYESQGLLAPTRRAGRRRYSRDELRRLVFIAIARDHGLALAAIRRALCPGPTGWAPVVDEQIAALDAQIARAERTRQMLLASRDCPAADPVRDCPHLGGALDRALAVER